MPLKTNVNTDTNDTLERKIKELSINNKLKKYQSDNPNIDEDTIIKLRSILEDQDTIDLEMALEQIEKHN